MTPQKPLSDAEIEAAVRAELPWLLERSRARAHCELVARDT